MGWGRTLLLGDIGNRMDIADVEQEVVRLRSKLSREMTGMDAANLSQDEQLERLFAENAELKLYVAGLIRLLVSKGQLAREELVAMVEQIDGEDGSRDGGYDGPIV